ncbi:RHS repeat-associated core domain-containing protein [Symbioplanes lichenis]|uniref:RHS repeat-associated core domain-containing protein n=1 Tax=Symbioplanes lichenis TaxID=1629072 RepID=UPI00273976D9|nr:RHS repeat-associated core domain-containing protein [Actinoplanes lichenis]
MARPVDWDVLDMSGDPTPGDPARLRQLAGRFHDFAETAHRAKLAVESLQGDGSLLTWVGLSGDAFRKQFGDFPNQVNKLYQSHLMAGDALEDFAPVLESAQAQADRALVDGRAAAEKLRSLQGALDIAQTDFTGASQAAKTAQAETVKPDPDQVKQAIKDADAAQQRLSAAQGQVNGAQQELDLAKQLAEQAKQMRDGAARTCVRQIEDASDAGIQPRNFWQKLGDALKELWNIICEVAKWVALVAGILAMIFGGPLAWIALAAGAVLLIKAIVDFSQGKGSVMDLVFGILGIIPGVKGLTSLSKLSQLYKAGGLKEIGKAALNGMKEMAKGMVGALKGLGAGLTTITKNLGGNLKGGIGKIGDLLRNLGNRPVDVKFTATELKIRDCVTDPVDVATGEVVSTARDLGLLQRTHVSSYRAGRWFGPLWTSVLDQRLELDDEGSCYFAPDGMILAYPHAEPGEPVLPLEGPRRPLTWYSDGSAEMHDPETGATLQFRPAGPVSALTSIIDASGRTEISWAGDTPVSITFPGGEALAVTVTDGLVTAAGDITYTYDDQRQLVEVVTGGGTERLEYTDGRMTAWHDWSGSYSYVYDERGRCVQTISSNGYLDGHIAYDDEQRTTTFTDALGNATVYRIGAGLRTQSRIDPLGRVTSYDWDRWGRMLSATDELGNDANPARGAGSADSGPDADGRVFGWIDGESGTIEPGPFGTVAAWTDATGARTTFAYDAELRLVAVTDPRGLVWRYEYDAAGQLIAETDFDGRRRTYEYDTAGRVVRQVNGTATDYAYDVHGRIIERRTGDDVATFTYDDAGRLVSARNSDTFVLLERDELGRLVRQTTNGRATTYTYDDVLMTRHRRTPSGGASAWSFERILGEATWLDVAGRQVTLDYEGDGREVRRRVDGKVALEQIYDGDRLATQRIGPADVLKYDGGGARVETAALGDVRTYSYDVKERLASVGGTVFTHDAAGRVIGVRGDGRDESYRYGPGGVLTAAGGGDFRYAGTMLVEGNGVAYEYDDRGRVVARTVDGLTWRFAWNELNQPAWALTPAGDCWRYLYDPLLRRVAKQRVDVANAAVIYEQTEFVWDGGTLVEETRTGADGSVRTVTWEHHPEAGYVVAEVRDGVLEVLVTDAIGTPVGDFDLWGRARGTGPATPLRFPGQYFDAETGLHYNVNRYYDPATARYLSQDPLGLKPAPDPASYVSNPLTGADPLGLMPACTITRKDFENLSFEKQYADIMTGSKANAILKNLVFRGDDKVVNLADWKFPTPKRGWDGKVNLISEHRVVKVEGATDDLAVHLNVMLKQTEFSKDARVTFDVTDFHLTARPLKDQLRITANDAASSIDAGRSSHWNANVGKDITNRDVNFDTMVQAIGSNKADVLAALEKSALTPEDAIDTLAKFNKDFSAKIINGLTGAENVTVKLNPDTTADLAALQEKLRKAGL